MAKKSGFSVSKILIGVGLVLIIVYIAVSSPPPPPSGSASSGDASAPKESSSAPAEEAEILFPVGELLTSKKRELYKDGLMTLSVPALDIENAPVLAGSDDETLGRGLGLYDYSCLPGEAANANVSIAGHRDIGGKEFYYIDTLKEGDLFYLDFDGIRYEYKYLESFIAKSDDWTIVPCREYSCLTLVSCHPIGTTLNRIVVLAELSGSEKIG